jgi:hypothetical protein
MKNRKLLPVNKKVINKYTTEEIRKQIDIGKRI